jgi:hypothetical protein
LPTTSETMNYLKGLGITNFKYSSLTQVGGMRPCFHPNGSLLTVDRNTKAVKIHEVPVTKYIKENESKILSSQLNILLKHTEIKGFSQSKEEIDN